MDTEKVCSIAACFQKSPAAQCREIVTGHINSTYDVTLEDGGRWIVQKINGYVFRDPDAVMRNIFGVTEHIARALEKESVSPERRVMHFAKAAGGKGFVRDENGDAWRMCRFIEGARAYDSAKNAHMLRETGRAFGEFQRQLADYPADTLTETIPRFHDTSSRFGALRAAAEKADGERLAQARDVLDAFLEREERLCLGTELLKKGEIPLRVTHNDTKINNVMIDDETGLAVCVIDLDTVMPGAVMNDFGDGIRTAAATAAEDEKDTAKAGLSLDALSAFADGFLSETGGSLTPLEKETLELGCEAMTGEVGVRFLTDYLEGDVYFRTLYPGHNLVRARNQLAMLGDIERKRAQAEKILRDITR